ncbi:repulsive guidance molecule A-like isoform X2 [Babylonia areolata]|uniref:repulsive guidance molecule A-like isoform X2 n=1 Tax=Babylonia areolata TaxID=304850 RepID=UPI003FD63704
MAMAPLTTDSGCVSEARPPPGPLVHHQPPEWKGMGPCRCHCRISRRHHHHHHRSTTTNITTTTLLNPVPPHRLLLLLFALVSFAWASVSGFSIQPNSQCQIDQCWEQYNEAKDALELSGGAVDGDHPLGGAAAGQSGAGGGGGGGGGGELDNEAHCVALRTYWHCIKGTKNSSRACQGNIRFYSVRNGVRNQMKQYNCTMNGRTLEPPEQGSGPPPLSPPPRRVPPHCQFPASSFRHCGLFGDPHLRTFADQFQTCKVKGAWPLVNNDYLTVQVTNDPVVGGSGDATATSKLTVIVKSHAECGSPHYHTYQAQTDSLPGAFEDGNTSYGPYGSVLVKEVEANRHVEIHVLYIATTIIVRQIGRYFTFAIHMPAELVNSSGQHHEPELCSKGCPPSEQIDYKQYLAHRRDRIVQLQSSDPSGQLTISRHEAEQVCRQSGLVDFYFDSCVFDLMATGDRNFTLAALSALKDVIRLDPEKAVQSSRSTLEPYDDMFSSAAASGLRTGCTWWRWWWWCLVCAVSAVLTLRPSPVALQVR